MNKIKVNKLGVIIDKTLFKNNDGDNINGPSLIKVPDFINNPLGKYYLYFGHHNGTYIRMAYADNILGPYKLYDQGVLHLKDIPGFDHLASPDVIIDNSNNRLIMYYHCPYKKGKNEQSSFYAYSNDGLNFKSEKKYILHPYFRYFNFNNQEYGICMYKHEGSMIMKKNNNCFKDYGFLLEKSRHTAIIVLNNRLFVFFTQVGDCPEHVYFSEIIKLEKNNIKVSEKQSLIKPEFKYEHNDLEPLPSEYGQVSNKINQLRDPFVFFDNGKIYLLYTVCGEKGIALCELQDFNL